MANAPSRCYRPALDDLRDLAMIQPGATFKDNLQQLPAIDGVRRGSRVPVMPDELAVRWRAARASARLCPVAGPSGSGRATVATDR